MRINFAVLICTCYYDLKMLIADFLIYFLSQISFSVGSLCMWFMVRVCVLGTICVRMLDSVNIFKESCGCFWCGGVFCLRGVDEC